MRAWEHRELAGGSSEVASVRKQLEESKRRELDLLGKAVAMYQEREQKTLEREQRTLAMFEAREQRLRDDVRAQLQQGVIREGIAQQLAESQTQMWSQLQGAAWRYGANTALSSHNMVANIAACRTTQAPTYYPIPSLTTDHRQPLFTNFVNASNSFPSPGLQFDADEGSGLQSNDDTSKKPDWAAGKRAAEAERAAGKRAAEAERYKNKKAVGERKKKAVDDLSGAGAAKRLRTTGGGGSSNEEEDGEER